MRWPLWYYTISFTSNLEWFLVHIYFGLWSMLLDQIQVFLVHKGNTTNMIECIERDRDLFHPKTELFSTRALIWVHFKTVHYFSQLIFSLFSYFKNALHNLFIKLCSAPFFKNIVQLFIKFTHSFLAIELLTFWKKCKKIFYCSRELSLFWLNK